MKLRFQAPANELKPLRYVRHGKRMLDLALSVFLLVILSPIIGWLILLTFLDSGRPIFFRQTRPGLHSKSFQLYKFRTLKDIPDSDGHLLPYAQHMTRFSMLLRRTHIDELPQLVNVLRGEMSLVGPRPLLTDYLQLYTPAQIRRHEVLPGITGLAQVQGGNQIPWEEKFRLDVWYVDHVSIGLDLKIMFMTFAAILKYRPGETQVLPPTAFTGIEENP
ncbi:MAG: sugar transferase [Chloroflexota bacterium]